MARFSAVAAAVAVLDQATKAWAVHALEDGPIEVLGSAVRFRLVRNPGSAFSLFTGMAPVLALIGIVLVVVIVSLGRREQDPWLALGLALVLGGALGNLSDRLLRDPGFLEGGVVDFIDIGAWPTFNVADAAITVGVAVILVRGWRSRRDDRVDD